MKRNYIIILLLFILFPSCKKEVATDNTITVETAGRDYLYDIMNSYYLWYDHLPVINKEDFKDPYELMDTMRYKPLDKWSFVQTYNEYLAMYQGSFVGHGIRIGLDPANQTRIVQIYKNSPLYSLGVRRGWIIKKINGTDLAPIFIEGDYTAYNNLIGASTEGITNTFLFQIPDGRDSTISTTKTSFTLNTVLVYDTLQLKSGITGHLVFDQFIPISNQELETAFAYFQQNNITDLIVDLRYNGGGDLNVLENMASYIAGTTKFNTPFLKLMCNDQHTAENETFNFTTVPYPMNLTKIITICTRMTASASEDLINGLKPHLDKVICLGDTTNGKPVGMIGVAYKTDYMFWPIAFSVVNSADGGDFYDGIAPEKYVPDDFTHDWSDRNETCLKEAIYYLEHGSVSPKRSYIYQPSVMYSEKGMGSNNAFILKK
jgi:carboxyl-terminal processing protease